jgi:hypothetical protein
MRDFACPSVKLLAPTAGASGLVVEGRASAGVEAWGFAAGAVWASAAAAQAVIAKSVATVEAIKCFMKGTYD